MIPRDTGVCLVLRHKEHRNPFLEAPEKGSSSNSGLAATKGVFAATWALFRCLILGVHSRMVLQGLLLLLVSFPCWMMFGEL